MNAMLLLLVRLLLLGLMLEFLELLGDVDVKFLLLVIVVFVKKVPLVCVLLKLLLVSVKEIGCILVLVLLMLLLI